MSITSEITVQPNIPLPAGAEELVRDWEGHPGMDDDDSRVFRGLYRAIAAVPVATQPGQNALSDGRGTASRLRSMFRASNTSMGVCSVGSPSSSLMGR
ncbi:hypothetical protein [Mycobacterium haemophilum]|uniref:hypothetical protein n=1 Tax=Mycobacterium haemophilum TaxID=29311 RepID=UPI000AA8ED5D|nr:hypothetical protein [Mycobacterium haemophilum]